MAPTSTQNRTYNYIKLLVYLVLVLVKLLVLIFICDYQCFHNLPENMLGRPRKVQRLPISVISQILLCWEGLKKDREKR